VKERALTGIVSEAQKQQFRNEGYFILESVIPAPHLEGLREACDSLVSQIEEEMDARGTSMHGISHRGLRYFISNRHAGSTEMTSFLFSDLMAEICRATLGPEAYLFVEQFVVKAAERGLKFGWHQDSGYVSHKHRPYLSCWCPLDDVSEENGTIYVLPYSRAGTRERREHETEEGTNDLIGYRGDDPGIAVAAPAGSIVVFSSTTFHRSGPNTSASPRRIYLAQYSAEPILKADGSGPWAMAIPFVREGEIVKERHPVAPDGDFGNQ